jgi:addiction module RelE/StbE family toxin
MQFEIFYSPAFKRAYKKLPSSIQETTKGKILLFISEPFHPNLKTHKLSGDIRGFWAFSIDYHNRVIFEFIGKQQVIFHGVGDHSIYRKK